MGNVFTNTTNRASSALPTNTVEIYDMNDFPAPSAGVITLVTNTLYKINAPLTTSDRFLFPAASDIAMETDHPAFNVITYTGTNVLFSSTGGIQRLVMDDVAVIATMSVSTIFGLIGSSATFGIAFIRNCSFLGFTIVGTFDDFPFVILEGTNISGFTSGMTATDVVVFANTNLGITFDPAGTGPAIKVIGNKTSTLQFDTLNTFVGAAAEIFSIDPDIAPNATVFLERVVKVGTGTFFSGTASKTIDSFVDVGFTAESITSVSDNGSGLAQFNFTAPPTLFVDQAVTLIGYSTNPAYNQTDVRITVTGAGTFETGVAFGSDEGTGTFTSNTVRCGSVTHGFANGTSLLLTESTDYDGGAKVYNTQTGSFDINRTFVADETAIATEGSLDETDPRMFVMNNGDQKDSMTIGAIVVGANSALTTIATQNVFVDLNLGVVLVSNANERFSLLNTTTGEIRYNGQNPVVLDVTGLIAASSSGGGQRFNFRALLNGSVLTSPDNVDIPMEVGNNLNATPLEWALTMDTGDLFRIQVANADGTSDITIDTFKLVIS